MGQVVVSHKIADFIDGIIAQKQFFGFYQAAVDKVLGEGHACYFLEQRTQGELVDGEFLREQIKGYVVDVIVMQIVENFIYAAAVPFNGIRGYVVGLPVQGVYFDKQIPQDEFYLQIMPESIGFLIHLLFSGNQVFVEVNQFAGVFPAEGQQKGIGKGPEEEAFQQVRLRGGE
jgi:hypothetical protein